jgi:hypothetical protein
MKKLLLHTCCGPCFLGTWEDLFLQDFEVTSLFYNPNIHPENEYKIRLKALEVACDNKPVNIMKLDYNPEEYYLSLNKIIDFPERCRNCYALRLDKTVKTAKENGFDAFSTTLLISPYQQHDLIISISKELERKYNINFYYSDFRKYFRTGQIISKELSIYRQKYCGCSYSKKEAE